MSHIRVELPIAAPTETVWPLLADFGAIDVFNPSVSKSRVINGSPASGVGSERQCDLSDGRNWIRERVVEWNEGRSYAVDIYEGTMPIEGIRTYLGVTPADGGSRGFMDMTYTPKFGLAGRLLDALVLKTMMRRTMTGVLRGLRDMAETEEGGAKDTVQRSLSQAA